MMIALLAASLAAAPTPCAPDPRVAAVAAAWEKRETIPALDLAGPDQARCFSQAFIARLRPKLGALVGYKVGLYSQAGRSAYHTDQPVLGRLYQSMLLAAGTAVPAAYGVAGSWESDFILVVKDDGLNTAKTRQEAYAHLRGYRPFIELSDRNYAADVPANVDRLVALDVGARLGVVGDEVALPPTPQGLRALVDTTVTATLKSAAPNTAAGEGVDRGVMRQTLGDPLDIVLFARDALLKEGGRLKAGDLISIGASTPAKPPRAGDVLTVDYDLVGAASSVSVEFR
jgi:2-keto-4-pentenoate hydratase